MNLSVLIRLCIMMFLQFFVWGAWYVTVGTYMSANGMESAVGWAYTVGPIAAIISPFFLGLVADRYFASERVLSALHLVGGAIMLCAPFVTGANALVLLLFAHMLCYMPTLGVTNTLAFHNISNQEKHFPIVRVFGTIGWIAANEVVSRFLRADASNTQFYVTGIAAIALGLFSLALPHTPPPSKGKKASLGEIVGVDAWAMMKDRAFAIFLVSSFLICIPLAAYYAFAPIYTGKVGFELVGATMKWGQMMEIVFMLIMPIFFARLGVKWMLALGMLAWVVRYGLFAAADENNIRWMVFCGIILHGICYDFFFVTGFIYTDKKCRKEIRGQAQGMLVLVTQGLGLGIGAQLMQYFKSEYTSGEVVQWGKFWLIPCLAAAVVLVAFTLLFRDRSVDDGKSAH
jgi:nucleoside transporter